MLEKRTIHVATCDKCGTTQDIMESQAFDARRTLVRHYEWIILHKETELPFKRDFYAFLCPDCVKKYISNDALPKEITIEEDIL